MNLSRRMRLYLLSFSTCLYLIINRSVLIYPSSLLFKFYLHFSTLCGKTRAELEAKGIFFFDEKAELQIRADISLIITEQLATSLVRVSTNQETPRRCSHSSS